MKLKKCGLLARCLNGLRRTIRYFITDSDDRCCYSLHIVDLIASPFVVFRGDSFQGVLARPEEALKTALIIRTSLLSRFKGKRTHLDPRIAIDIGIGTIDYLPRDQVGEVTVKLLEIRVRNLTK